MPCVLSMCVCVAEERVMSGERGARYGTARGSTRWMPLSLKEARATRATEGGAMRGARTSPCTSVHPCSPNMHLFPHPTHTRAYTHNASPGASAHRGGGVGRSGGQLPLVALHQHGRARQRKPWLTMHVRGTSPAHQAIVELFPAAAHGRLRGAGGVGSRGFDTTQPTRRRERAASPQAV